MRRRPGRAIDLAQEERAQPPGSRGASLAMDGRAGALHDAAVGDAGRADGLAVAALEALVEVADDVRRELDEAFGERPDQVEAAARRLGLESGLDESGAGLQAEAAADALREVFFGRGVGPGRPWASRHQSFPRSGRG